METTKFLVSITILTVVSNAAAFMIREEIKTTNTSDGPLSLVQATKQAVEYLGEARTSSETKIVLQDLIDRATALLQGSDTVYDVAVIFNQELALLSQYADDLNETIATGDSNHVREIIVAIRHIASRIIREIDYSDFGDIEYHYPHHYVDDIDDIEYHDPEDDVKRADLYTHKILSAK